jgi:hypothetical protein
MPFPEADLHVLLVVPAENSRIISFLLNTGGTL